MSQSLIQNSFSLTHHVIRYNVLILYVYVSSSCQQALFGYSDFSFFLGCKANARVNPAKKGHGPHPSIIFVLFYVLFVLCRSVYWVCVCACVCVCVQICTCLLYYCHRVATQLQLTIINCYLKSENMKSPLYFKLHLCCRLSIAIYSSAINIGSRK